MIVSLLNWMIAVTALSAILAIAFGVFAQIKSIGACDRYCVLKVSVALLVILPLLSSDRWFEFPQDAFDNTVVVDVQSVPAVAQTIAPDSYVDEYAILVGLVLYAVFFVIGIARYLASHGAMIRLKKRSKKHNVFNGIQVYVHDDVLPPCTIGVFRPVILISRDALSRLTEAESQLVFLHEWIHVRRFDVLVHQLGLLTKVTLCFSPFVHWIVKCLQEEMELSCDEEVRMAHPNQRRLYGEILLSLSKSTSPRIGHVYSGLFASQKIISRRIRAMCDPMRRRRWVAVFAFAALFVGVSFPTVVVLAANGLTEFSLPVEEGKIGIQYTMRGFSGDHLDFESVGRINLSPGIETVVGKSTPNLLLTARATDQGVQISAKIMEKDSKQLIAAPTIVVESQGSARVEVGAGEKGEREKSISLELKHLGGAAVLDRSATKIWVPFKKPTPLQDTIARMSSLTNRNIILPKEFISGYDIQILTKEEELEIRQVILAYRSALNARGLDLVEVDSKVLKVGKIGGEKF